MAIDPTIALGVTPYQNQFNPLANVGQVAQTGNALVGLQNAQQQLAARNAIGQAVAASTDPTTGNVDQGKVRALMAANPAAQYGLQEADANTQSQTSQQLGNEAQTLKNQGQKIGFLAGLTAPLAANPNTTKSDVQDTIQHAVNFGLIDSGTAQQVLNSMPSDSAGVRATLGNFLKSTMGPTEEYGHVYGTNSSINQGPNVVSGVTGPADQGGGFSGSTATPLGISPEAAASQQTGIDPATGQPIAQTTAARLQSQGAGALVNPGQTRPMAPGAQKYPWNQGGTYGQQPAAAPTTQPADFGSAQGTPASGGQPPAPAAAPTTQVPGAVAVGMAPGVTGAMAAQQQAGADASNSLMQGAAGTTDRKAILGNMLSDSTGFTSGPGYDNLRHLESLVNNWTGAGINQSGIESAQSFNKFGQQIAQQQATALGAGSDAKLASAVMANPNSHLQTSTNQQIIHVLQGNEDAISAKANAWQGYLQNGGKPGDYQAWNQSFNQNFDPRAYQMLRMTPEEQAHTQQQMQASGQLSAFQKTVNAMAAAKLLPLPGSQATPAGQAAPGGN